MLLTIAFAGPLADLYGEPRLAPVLRWYSLAPLLTSISVVQIGAGAARAALSRSGAAPDGERPHRRGGGRRHGLRRHGGLGAGGPGARQPGRGGGDPLVHRRLAPALRLLLAPFRRSLRLRLQCAGDQCAPHPRRPGRPAAAGLSISAPRRWVITASPSAWSPSSPISWPAAPSAPWCRSSRASRRIAERVARGLITAQRLLSLISDPGLHRPGRHRPLADPRRRRRPMGAQHPADPHPRLLLSGLLPGLLLRPCGDGAGPPDHPPRRRDRPGPDPGRPQPDRRAVGDPGRGRRRGRHPDHLLWPRAGGAAPAGALPGGSLSGRGSGAGAGGGAPWPPPSWGSNPC